MAVSVWVGGSALLSAFLAGSCWLDRKGEHQLVDAVRQRGAACSNLDVPWPQTQAALKDALGPGESGVKWAIGGGYIVCLRPGETRPSERFAEIQRRLDCYTARLGRDYEYLAQHGCGR